MTFNISKNRIIGFICLIVFVIFITFRINDGFAKGLLFFFLGTIISAASLLLSSIAYPSDYDENWFSLIPFTVLMVFSRLILGWDILLPFLVCGFCALTVRGIADLKVKNKPKNLEFSIIEASVASFVSLVLFICICGFVGVYI